MNLYAIQPDWTIDSPDLIFAINDKEALEHAVYVAANDMVDGNGAPTATVYLVAADVPVVGQSRAATLLTYPTAWSHSPAKREELSRNLAEHEGLQVELENGDHDR